MSSKNDREPGPANTREGMRRRTLLLSTTSLVAASGISATAPSAQAQQPQEILPKPAPAFQGKIGRTVKDSTPDFPKSVEAPGGAPNVLLILTDDVGFGATSTFGGPIQTPNFQRLADSGLRYNMYHTTALCSPTRAALITGRNHHSVASGVITEFATGYPGYNSLVPKSAGSVGSVLKDNGYRTSWFGKMHNVPDWMSSQAGPFDLWPTGLGFEYFYGFLGGDSDQWHPALYDGTNPIEPYLGDPNYILDRDLADKAIAWMRMQHALAPNKPWLLYYATGTAHAPHHAPKDWIAKYKGQFDQGWDKVREETLARQIKLSVVPTNTQLTKRPEQIPAWDSLSFVDSPVPEHFEVLRAVLCRCRRVIKGIDEADAVQRLLLHSVQDFRGGDLCGLVYRWHNIRPRFVLEVRRGTLRNADHTREVDELAAASGQAGWQAGIRLRLFQSAGAQVSRRFRSVAGARQSHHPR